MSFDFRANTLNEDTSLLPPQALSDHERYVDEIVASIAEEFGALGIDQKVSNFRDIGAEPHSIIAYHNQFLRQARGAFVAGHYYPALIGACALGERILNHLLLSLRDQFKGAQYHNKIAGKNSYDNWGLAIDCLEAWGVLRNEAVPEYRALARTRNDAVHFRRELEDDPRSPALKALKLISRIVDLQFGAFGPHPWFISIPGEVFISSSWERVPFVETFYLPACWRVSPYHWLEWNGAAFDLHDYQVVNSIEISDEQFLELRHKAIEEQVNKMSSSGC